jgi:hypothetical protein
LDGLFRCRQRNAGRLELPWDRPGTRLGTALDAVMGPVVE